MPSWVRREDVEAALNRADARHRSGGGQPRFEAPADRLYEEIPTIPMADPDRAGWSPHAWALRRASVPFPPPVGCRQPARPSMRRPRSHRCAPPPADERPFTLSSRSEWCGQVDVLRPAPAWDSACLFRQRRSHRVELPAPSGPRGHENGSSSAAAARSDANGGRSCSRRAGLAAAAPAVGTNVALRSCPRVRRPSGAIWITPSGSSGSSS